MRTYKEIKRLRLNEFEIRCYRHSRTGISKLEIVNNQEYCRWIRLEERSVRLYHFHELRFILLIKSTYKFRIVFPQNIRYMAHLKLWKSSNNNWFFRGHCTSVTIEIGCFCLISLRNIGQSGSTDIFLSVVCTSSFMSMLGA